MAKNPPDLLQGTLDMLVLKSLQDGSNHGYSISLQIRKISNDALKIEHGSLYPALYRLEKKGWIHSDWGISEHNRRARFYKLTPTGRKHLGAETSNWVRTSAAINLVLKVV
jgi:PadR family transcriptional regulator PadR